MRRWLLIVALAVSFLIIVVMTASMNRPTIYTKSIADKLAACNSVEEVETLLGKASRNDPLRVGVKDTPHWILASDLERPMLWLVQPQGGEKFRPMVMPVITESWFARLRRLVGL